MTPDEIAAVKAEHHRCHDGHPWCAVDGCEYEWPCLPYRLAVEVERLAGKVEAVRTEVSAWPLNAWMTQRVLSLLSPRDVAFADQSEQAQP